MCHRRALSLPIALLSATEAIMVFFIFSDCDRGWDTGPRVIALKGEILILEVENLLHIRI